MSTLQGPPKRTEKAYRPTVAEWVTGVRTQSYANSTEEARTVKRVDEFAGKQVAGFEAMLVTQINDHARHVEKLHQEAQEHMQALAEIAAAANADEDLDLGDWQGWDDSAAGLIDAAYKALPGAEAAIAKVQDPLAELSALQAKFPSLNRPIP